MCPRLDGNNLYTSPLFKNMVRVPKPTRTCKIFLAFVHNLTFLSCVQGLLEKACFLRHFGKNERRRRSLSEHVDFFKSMAGTSLFHLQPQAWARTLFPTPISEKTNTWSGQARPGQARPSQARPSQARPSQARPSQADIASDIASDIANAKNAWLACWLLAWLSRWRSMIKV